MPIGTSRLNQSKIKAQTAWIWRKASKIEWPDCRSVSTMPMPKIAANTSTRTLSLDDNEANILVGIRAKMPNIRGAFDFHGVARIDGEFDIDTVSGSSEQRADVG